MTVRRVSLNEIAEIGLGFAFKSADFSKDGTGTRLLRGDNIVQGTTRWNRAELWPDDKAADPHYQLAEDDVVLAMDRPWIEAGLKFAKIQRADLPSLLVQRVARLRVKAGNDQRFLSAVIGSRSFTDYVLSVQTGTAVPHISGGQIGNYSFEIPNLAVQTAIAEVLGALDDKIASNIKIAATIDDFFMARWRQVDQRRKPGTIDRPLASMILETIAGDWGVELSTSTHTEGAYCMRGADISSLQRSGLGRMPTRFIKPRSLQRRNMTSGDIVVEMSGGSPTQSTGRPAYVTDQLLARLDRPLISSNFCRVLRMGDATYSSFVYAMLRWDWANGEFFQYENGSTGIKNLAFGEYAARRSVPILDPTDLASFNDAAQALFASASALGAESDMLVATRDALLPQLMSGKLRVRDAEMSLAGVL
ncbi:restriction endonuclease subunit S [Cryobacterium sp. Hh11]|uniref:restriction endonuclease subunit S n=1 Tax=Cryobacterium sp. Hh11 TaxID=2555868 RepID=UPI00141B2E0A|nr:restriction endonuclease subunit S [Cryobacterium sp. Hh11]